MTIKHIPIPLPSEDDPPTIKTIKVKDVENQFSSWDGWNCNVCGELIANDFRDLVEHLEEDHNIEVEKN